MASINLTGVSHLFVVPRIRSSTYLTSLVEACPSLLSVSPSSQNAGIGGKELPHLRTLTVVNNTSSESEFRNELDGVPIAKDFREILRWGEDGKLSAEADGELRKDDVMNIQFTRSVIDPTFKSRHSFLTTRL